MTSDATPGGNVAMTVVVNGEAREVPAGITALGLVESLGLRPGSVVVERNGMALLRSEVAALVLVDGDRLELVRAVAGG